MKVSDIYKEIHEDHQKATQANNLDKLAEVAGRYELLLNDAPEDLAILFGLGTAKMQCGLNGAAIVYFQKCLQIKDLPEVWNNLGTAFKAEHHNDAAEACWHKALGLRQDPDYYNNLATLYINEGTPKEGMQYVVKGLELNSEHPRLHWNKSLLLLEQGMWEDGFLEYDYGLASMDRPVRNYSDDPEKVPFWEGQKGRVVVYGEQGMGDEVMFASCIPDMISDLGVENVVFDCHPRMTGLFERSFGIKCYGTRKSENIEWPRREQLDYKIAIGSLFGIYRHRGKFPRQIYLRPDPDLVTEYMNRLAQLGDPPYVGIGWRAGVKKTRTDLRSIKLKEFIPLMEQGGTFVSLQYDDDATRKTTQFEKDTGYKIHHWPNVVEAGPYRNYGGYDYDHTVALIKALNLCILPNTSAVHVCGAIGQECWTLTPPACAWRYQLKGRHMPMYGSWVKQYREGMEEVVDAYSNRWARSKLARAQSGS